MRLTALALALTSWCVRAQVEEEAPPPLTTARAAITSGVSLTDFNDTFDARPFVHGRLDVSTTRDRMTLTARGSVLMSVRTLSDLAGNTVFLTSFQDLGSFVEASVALTDDTRFAVRLLPFSARQARPGFDFANDWGRGAPLSAQPTPQLEPTAELLVESARWHAAIAGRFSLGDDSGMGGFFGTFDALAFSRPALVVAGGVEPGAGFTLDGRVTVLERKWFTDTAVEVMGGAQLAFRRGVAVGEPIDLLTYANDPLRFERQFRPHARGVGGEVVLEGGVATSRALTAPEVPLFVQLRLGLQVSTVRLFSVTRLRNSAHLWWDTPFPTTTLVTPTAANVASHVGIEWQVHRVFAPGVTFRVLQPGIIRAEYVGGLNPPPRDNALFSVANADDPLGWLEPTRLRGGLKFTARFEPMPWLTVLGELDIQVIPDGQRQVDDGSFVELGARTTAQVMAQVRL